MTSIGKRLAEDRTGPALFADPAEMLPAAIGLPNPPETQVRE